MDRTAVGKSIEVSELGHGIYLHQGRVKYEQYITVCSGPPDCCLASQVCFPR